MTVSAVMLTRTRHARIRTRTNLQGQGLNLQGQGLDSQGPGQGQGIHLQCYLLQVAAKLTIAVKQQQ